MKGELVEKETVTAVLERLAREKFNLSDSYQTYLSALMDADAAVSEIPAADVAPVVRCRECRHRDPEDRKCDCGGWERQGCQFSVQDNYFCAYGER